MSVENVLNGLDLLAYDAEKRQQINKEKFLYTVTKLIRAGRAMYLDLQTVAKDKAEETGQPQKDFEYFSAKAWDEATKEDL